MVKERLAAIVTDHIESPKASNLAMNNSGGILLAVVSAAIGVVMGNPLLVLAGIAAGFVAGNIGLDGKRSVVSNLTSGHDESTLGQVHLPQEDDLPIATTSVSLPPLAAGAFTNVAFDQSFSPNDTSPASPTNMSGLRARPVQHRR